MRNFSHTPKRLTARGQAMIEFAIVTPILFLLLFGLFEVGRMLFVYSAVNNASREAIRYGSAVGLDDYGEIKYKHCAGIREMARRSAYFMNLQDADIEIDYDNGPGTSVFHTCTGDVDPGYFIKSGDRILVTVTGQYTPYTKLVPWGSRTFVSSSARTILAFVDLAQTAVPTSTSTTAPTGAPGTPTGTPTETPTETPTATPTDGDIIIIYPTFTPLPSETIEPSATPTPTETMTPTPSATPTTVTGCESVTADPISIPGTTPTMSMTINNPNSYPLTVKDIRVTWNAATGGPGNTPLTLQYISLPDQLWTIKNTTGDFTITPSEPVIMPASATSIITFTFDQNYENPNGSESITISLSTPGCENVVLRRP